MFVEYYHFVKLKNCPCCNKKAHFRFSFERFFGLGHHARYSAHCSACGLHTRLYRTRQQAANAWNMRGGRL